MTAEEQTGRGRDDGPDDAVLVSRILSGDTTVFEVLVHRYQALVFHVAGGFLRTRADVEEVAQETFLRAFRGLAGFRGSGRFASWIARIATTASLERLRRSRGTTECGWDGLSREEREAVKILAAGGTPSDDVVTRDLASRALDRLSPRARALVLLVDGHGFTPGEAARLIGSSGVAARVQLHRARRALRGEIEGLLGAPGRRLGGG